MSIKNEDAFTPDFERVLDLHLKEFKNMFFIEDRIPMLKEVRGKVVMIRRYEIKGDEPRGINLSGD
jgi:hypothetical protein